MNVLVTGSSGFIASRFVEKLLWEGHQVYGLDIRKPQFEHPNFVPLTCDITDRKSLQKLRFPYGVDCCYHFAAVANLNEARENTDKAVFVNVVGTFNMAEFCLEHSISLFNFISTCCVYGDTNEHPTTENAPKNPTDAYGFTKLAGEYVSQNFRSHGLDVNILRLATCYGEGMRKELAIYIFLKHALEDEKIPIHGKGDQTRCFIYIDDVTDALYRILDKDIRNETINIAGAEEISVLALAKECLGTIQPVRKFLSNPQIAHVEDRPGQIRQEQIDISKAKSLLGWKPKTTIKGGLEKTLGWMSNAG